MKKRLALIGMAVMGLSLLSGCGSNSAIPDYSKYVTLGNYEGLEYVPKDTTVTDDQIQSKIDSFLEENKISTEITDRPAKEGDKINIDYVGSVDGVEFEGGSTQGKGTEVTVGSSGYIDNFDEQLEGMKVGETKDINVTFPEDYGKEELNGKAAKFVTTLNKIIEETTPELTDELVAEKTDCKTVDEYKAKVKEDLQKQADKDALDSKHDQLLEAAAKNSTYSAYPEEEIKKLVDDAVSNAKSQASSYGLEFAQYVSIFYGASSEEDFEKKIGEDAKKYMEQRMTVCAIARKEKLSASDDDIKAYIAELLEEYPQATEEDVRKAYTDEQLTYFVIEKKVAELLEKTAVEGEATTEETSEEDTVEETSEDASEAESTEEASVDASEAESTEADSADASTTEAETSEEATEASEDTTEEASTEADTETDSTEAASTEAE